MADITMAAAQLVLSPYHPVLHGSMHRAFNNWREFGAPNLPLCRGRTLANYIQDKADMELRTHLGANPSVQMSRPQRDRFWMIFKGPEGDVLVRIKKLNPDFTTNNFRTPTAEAFDRQQELECVPSAPRITLGYRLNTTETQLVGVWVVFLDGSHVLWKYEIVEGPDGTTMIGDEPVLPHLPAAGIKLKPTAKKKLNSK